MRRVVVTGLGVVSPLASGTEATWKRLLNNESGIRGIQSFDVQDLPCKIAGQVPRGDIKSGNFNPDEYVTPKDQKKMDDFIIMAMGAAHEAVTTEWLGPRKPCLIETWPEARLISADGMKNGLTRRGPRSFSTSEVS